MFPLFYFDIDMIPDVIRFIALYTTISIRSVQIFSLNSQLPQGFSPWQRFGRIPALAKLSSIIGRVLATGFG